MASITNEDGVSRRVPSASRCLKELRKVFPGAHFAKLQAARGDAPAQTFLELRYHPHVGAAFAPVCAAPADGAGQPALVPLALLRAAFRRFGYDSNARLVNGSWAFDYAKAQEPTTTPETVTAPAEVVTP